MEKKMKQRRLNVDLPEEIITQIKVESAVSRISIRQFIMWAVLCGLAAKKAERRHGSD